MFRWVDQTVVQVLSRVFCEVGVTKHRPAGCGDWSEGVRARRQSCSITGAKVKKPVQRFA
jgi:hypothetical protein